jgi:diguanylate cyclase (GGDEF)-like protein
MSDSQLARVRQNSLPPTEVPDIQARTELARVLARLSKDLADADNQALQLDAGLIGLIGAAGPELSALTHPLIMRCAQLQNALDASVAGLGAIGRLVDIQTQQLVDLRAQAALDGLTGVCNRRTFEQYLPVAVKQALEHAERMSLVVLDVDHFKAVNDTYGHPAGDIVLRHIARQLTAGLRSDDVVFRLGGEEFALMLHGAPEPVASDVVERLRLSVAENPIDAGCGPMAVTLSAGIAHLGPAESHNRLYQRADDAMYLAKRGGRNRLCISGG